MINNRQEFINALAFYNFFFVYIPKIIDFSKNCGKFKKRSFFNFSGDVPLLHDQGFNT